MVCAGSKARMVVSQWRSKAMISLAMDMVFATATWPLQIRGLDTQHYLRTCKVQSETLCLLGFFCEQFVDRDFCILWTWCCHSATCSKPILYFLPSNGHWRNIPYPRRRIALQAWRWSSTCIGTLILVSSVATTSACTSHLAKASWVKSMADRMGVGP